MTKAGQGFAAKNGVDPALLQKKEVAGKKGQYAVAVRSVVGVMKRSVFALQQIGVSSRFAIRVM